MFGKSIENVNYNDIVDLVTIREIREGYRIDYKTEIGNPDKAKKELAKDITAFANSGGGFLIIGIDKEGKIKGIDKQIQNKDVDEWINQVLSSNTDPVVYYFDPKTIIIPDTDKVVLVIEVPESTNKPHMVIEGNNYYIRINDSCKAANHSQIKNMFESSRNNTDLFNAFLKKRNLLDVESTDFGINVNSKELYSEIPSKMEGYKKPFVLFNIIPKSNLNKKTKVSFQHFKNWLDNSQNSSGYEPATWQSLYYHWGADGIITQNGIIFKAGNNELKSYFEVLEDGFIETGFSSTITYVGKDSSARETACIYLTPIITYQMLLLNFLKRFYEFLGIQDEVMVQLSFVNTLNLKLYGFNNIYNNNFRYDYSNIKNIQSNNFKLINHIQPHKLTSDYIQQIAKESSESICRAFGLDKDYCFDENGSISANRIRNVIM